MKKIKIGIPRAFLYYRDYVFWKYFFEKIGCNVILSPNTNREIIDTGKALAVDENCLPFKIYLGHISYLMDKCDYVLIPRVCNYGKGKRVCMRFNGIYDVVCNLFPDIKIINYDIDYLRFRFEFIGFMRIGFKFNKNIFKVMQAYFMGKIKKNNYEMELINGEINKLKSNKLKILIVSHPYVMYDEFIGGSVTRYLKENDIEVLYSDRMDKKESICYAEEFSNTLYWLYSKENIGSAIKYKNAVDGIIFLSSFPCGVDSLVNELAIRKIKGVPIINIVMDESSATSGLYTRLESFIDIIKGRRYDG